MLNTPEFYYNHRPSPPNYDKGTVTAQDLLERCDGSIKCAIVVHTLQVDPEESRELLESANEYVKKVKKDNVPSA